MLSLEEFLKSAQARGAAQGAIGESLAGLGVALPDGRLGGTQFAYDVTVLIHGMAPLRLARGHLNGTIANLDPACMAEVDALLAMAIRTRMTARHARKFGLAEETKTVGSAIVYLTAPDAPIEKEVALVVCCAGLSGQFNESYAERIAGTCKTDLLLMLAALNAALTTHQAVRTTLARNGSSTLLPAA